MSAAIPTTKVPRELAERESCPACQSDRHHTGPEWAHHPLAGHGFTKEQGWTHQTLKEEATGA